MKNRGFFITFEGLEGSGKTTQIKLLVKKLQKAGYHVVATREPGGTEIGEKIRKITHDHRHDHLSSTAEAYLMAAARAQHVVEVIKPALNEGKTVISDRFLDSSLAYQGVGRKLGMDEIVTLNEPAVDGIEPDMTIYLDIPPQTGLQRKKKNGDRLDRLDSQSEEFYSRVYRGYRTLMSKYPTRVIAIDAEGDIGEIAQEVWKEVEKRVKS